MAIKSWKELNLFKKETPVLSTFNQMFGAQEWFPTKVSLNDKIEKFDFKIIRL
jgi:hypothetical protein